MYRRRIEMELTNNYQELLMPNTPMVRTANIFGNQTTATPSLYSLNNINATPVYIPPQRLPEPEPQEPQIQEPIQFLRVGNSAVIELTNTARWRAYCSTQVKKGCFTKKTLYEIRLQWFDLVSHQERNWIGASSSASLASSIMKDIYKQLDAYRRIYPVKE